MIRHFLMIVPRMRFPAEKILVIVTRRIGDVLLTTPLLRSLRLAYRNALIDVLVYVGTEGVLAGNPDVSNVITVSKHPNIREYASLVSRIFRRYDLALAVQCGDRPAIYSFEAARKRVNIVPACGVREAWKRFITSAWVELDSENTHTVIQNLRFCDVLGIPRYYEVIAPESPKANQALERKLPFSLCGDPFAVFHMVPLRVYKRWKLEGWVKMAEYFACQGFYVVITGGGGGEEKAYVRSAVSRMPENVVNLAGRLSFGEVSFLLRSCRLYIGVDTSVTHLAAATGAPTVALYGPTNPVTWAPWPHGYSMDKNPFERKGTQRVGNVLLIQGEGDCVPCHQEGCERNRRSKSRCLDELSVRKVIEGVNMLLSSADFVSEQYKSVLIDRAVVFLEK
jgi:heptosyltransferase-3